jgi:hypothetical protein
VGLGFAEAFTQRAVDGGHVGQAPHDRLPRKILQGRRDQARSRGRGLRSVAVEPTGVVFAVVIIGRLGNPLGALFAGLLIGASESLAMAVLSPAWAPVVSFSVLIAILLWNPEWA